MAPRRYLLSAAVAACVLVVTAAAATDAAVVDADSVGDGAAFPAVMDDMGGLSADAADVGDLDGVAAGRQTNADQLVVLRNNCQVTNFSCLQSTHLNVCTECNVFCKRYQRFANSLGRQGHAERARVAAKTCRKHIRRLRR